ncbi:glycoside hydrolase family 32 protein [Bacillus kwashiorkori]|uniref:glycoside hydrolase family 32 protein n=1 Tax=Bacillus kwashiorkori TaxID=1522318 RepID=UPI000784EC2B|nr:glycoside hydrolase family 32 protein [Bacillus kwashiorkori]
MKIDQNQKYRPSLHFSPKEKWLNDPNGLVFFKGEYHLFYQHNPNDSVWGPMHWGHAVSKDLIEWEQLDIAIYPDELGTIFSGSAVIDWNNTTGFFPNDPGIVAIYTQHLDSSDETGPKQVQSIAYSHDHGRSWIKYNGNPVLTHPTKVDFRDPKVFWYEQENKWIMSLATGQTISFYSSRNLIVWKFESEFGENIGFHEGVWECPDLFELPVENSGEKKWMLIVSVGDNSKLDEGSRSQYFIGSFDGNTFKPEHEEIKWLDYGKDNYAGVSFSDIPEEDGRRIYLAWMSNWRYANQVPTEGWRGQMTLPRELSLKKVDGDINVVQRVVKELDSYFQVKEEITDIMINDASPLSVNISERFVDVDLSFKNSNSSLYGVTVHHTKSHYTGIHIDTNNNTLTVTRENSGEVDFSDNFSLSQSIVLMDTSELKLRLIVDSASIELFVNEGEYSLTSLIFPNFACERISLFSADGEVQLKNGKFSVPSK